MREGDTRLTSVPHHVHACLQDHAGRRPWNHQPEGVSSVPRPLGARTCGQVNLIIKLPLRCSAVQPEGAAARVQDLVTVGVHDRGRIPRIHNPGAFHHRRMGRRWRTDIATTRTHLPRLVLMGYRLPHTLTLYPLSDRNRRDNISSDDSTNDCQGLRLHVHRRSKRRS